MMKINANNQSFYNNNSQIQINLNPRIIETINRDAQLFEIQKKNGEYNCNKLLNLLISNYLDIFERNRNMIDTTLKKILTPLINKNNINGVCDQIENLMISNDSKDNKKVSLELLRFRKTQISNNSFDLIQTYCGQAMTPNEYLKMLLNSYANLQQNKREQIIFKQNYEKLLTAINKQQLLSIQLTKYSLNKNEITSRPHLVIPYKLSESKEELFNYLIGIEDGKCATYRLCRIDKVFINTKDPNKNLPITDKQKDLLEKMIAYGPEYAFNPNEVQPIKVKLTNNGIIQFQESYLQRPTPIDKSIIENSDNTNFTAVYSFDCTYEQVFQYFRKFGKNACITEPAALKTRLSKFYTNGYKSNQN